MCKRQVLFIINTTSAHLGGYGMPQLTALPSVGSTSHSFWVSRGEEIHPYGLNDLYVGYDRFREVTQFHGEEDPDWSWFIIFGFSLNLWIWEFTCMSRISFRLRVSSGERHLKIMVIIIGLVSMIMIAITRWAYWWSTLSDESNVS